MTELTEREADALKRAQAVCDEGRIFEAGWLTLEPHINIADGMPEARRAFYCGAKFLLHVLDNAREMDNDGFTDIAREMCLRIQAEIKKEHWPQSRGDMASVAVVIDCHRGPKPKTH